MKTDRRSSLQRKSRSRWNDYRCFVKYNVCIFTYLLAYDMHISICVCQCMKQTHVQIPRALDSLGDHEDALTLKVLKGGAGLRALA